MRICINYPDEKLYQTDTAAELLGLSRSAFISLCVSHYIATVMDYRKGATLPNEGQSKNDTNGNR